MKYTIILSLIVLFSVFSRFYHLAWGAPYFFHPDERNIASSISQLNLQTSMHPHFFAYGSLPLYSIYALGVVSNVLQITHNTNHFTVSFEQAIIIGRIYSALLSLATILLLYIIGKTIHSKILGILTAVFAATSIGFIQYAHFATFEMWLTFFSLLLVYVSLLFLKKQSKKYLFYLGAVWGILLSIKISSAVLGIPILLVLLITLISMKEKWHIKIGYLLIQLSGICFLALTTYLITNPYILIDPQSFLGSMQYETTVATGQLPVFYTQGFIQTTPILYQLVQVYPFILTPLITLLSIVSFGYIIFITSREKQKQFAIVLIYFFVLFFSQAFLFVKWTRYMIPTLPFIYLMLSLAFIRIYTQTQHAVIKKTIAVLLLIPIAITLFTAYGFLLTTYQEPDSRVAAHLWAQENIPHDATILSEVYDLGIVPFNETYKNITLFNFYDLDMDAPLLSTLQANIANSDYIILPSQRIIKNRILHPKQFPQSSKFYLSLHDEKKFKKIYETPCAFFCKLIYLGDPLYHVEETASVFDRPIISIYKKI